MKTKKKKLTRKELERKLFEARSQQIHTHHFAKQTIHKCSTDRLMGSGVIIQLSFLGGEEVIPATCISGGLSNETIEALKKDLVRSWNYKTELGV